MVERPGVDAADLMKTMGIYRPANKDRALFDKRFGRLSMILALV
jgi:hypothetical protein